MRRLALAAGLAALALAGLGLAIWWNAAAPGRPEAVEIVGDIDGAYDVSGVALVGDWLVLGTDESNKVHILRREGDRFVLVRQVALDRPGAEIDIEAVAADGDMVYVIGSHSRFRPRKARGQVIHD